jgi:acyl dehydratase
MDELRWLKPVRPGDTLYAEAEVKELRPSGSKPDRGVCRMGFTARNQKQEAVMTFTATILLARRKS